jgi:hypothetical protein
MTQHKPANAVNAPHKEQEKINYLSMRFIDILELLYKENKRAIDITCPLKNGTDVIVTITVKDLGEQGTLHPSHENKTLMDMIELLSEYHARDIDVIVPRLNGEVVEATIKLSVKEKTVA